jgi:amino acid adenylation domain-containing protein
LESGGIAGDLFMVCSPGSDGDGLDVSLEYASDAYSAEDAAAVLQGYLAVVEWFLGSPSGRIDRFSLASPSDLQKVLAWEGGKPIAKPTPSVCEAVGRWARETPEAVAIEAGVCAMSYGELEHTSERIAQHLYARGVGPGVLVGVMLERTPKLVPALVAILKTGAAYVALDPAQPAARLRQIVDETDPKLVLCDGESPPHFGASALLVDVEALWEEASRPAVRERLPGGQGLSLAYVLYTSGSTGRPKGVAVTHGGVAALVAWAQRSFEGGASHRVLAATPLGFDVAVFELLVTLALGGRVCLVRDHLSLIDSTPATPTVLCAVPAVLRELASARAIPDSVEVVCSAGEPLPADLAKQLWSVSSVRRVLNLYGPTESTVYATAAELDSADPSAPSIGRAIAGTRAVVLDRALHRVPPGMPGELYLSGAGLARGYLARPDLTADAFVPSLDGSGARMYRTGDIAVWREDGSLHFCGRKDAQLKIRGVRIEPGEVECALRAHERVHEAAVAEVPKGSGILGGYVVWRPGTCESPEALAPWLRSQVPAAMVPEKWVVLTQLPRTSSGKVDRSALPQPLGGRGNESARAVMSETEADVATMYEQLLGTSNVGPHDDFFRLGGHSLLATRLVARVRGQWHVPLSLVDFFREPRVADVANNIDTLRWAASLTAPSASASERREEGDRHEPRSAGPGSGA